MDKFRHRLRFWWSYFRGKMPWDTGIVPPEILALADRLLPGRALDLGCGTGTTSVFLAQRGWQVTGVDFIPGAIQQARQRARAAQQTVDFHVGDVSRLDFLPGPYDFLIDIGCLHGLTPDQQDACIREIARLACPGATFALYAFGPCIRNGRRIGLTADEIAARFAPAFIVKNAVQGADTGNGLTSGWYYLERTTTHEKLGGR